MTEPAHGGTGQPMMSEVKVELDVAEEAGSWWRTQNQYAGIPCDLSMKNASATITSSNTNRWDPSATVIKSEPDSDTDEDPCGTAKPVDHYMTVDMPFQSLDRRKRKVDLKCEPYINDDPSSLPFTWKGDSEEGRESHSWNQRSNSTMDLDVQAKSIRRDDSDVIETEEVPVDISSDVQTKAVTGIVRTMTCDPVHAEVNLDRDANMDGPKEKWMERLWPVKEERQDMTSAVDLSIRRHSDNTTGSLQPLNRSRACLHCSASFVLASRLELHMASVHGEKPQDPSLVSSIPDGQDMATYSSGHREMVDRPSDGEHEEEMNYNMDSNDFGKKFGKKKKRPLVCDICYKTFTRPTSLKMHQFVHTSYKPFPCDLCDKAFTRAGHLKTHKLVHADIRNKAFVCELCTKAFDKASDLKRHEVIHTSHKPFVCDMCNKAFTQAGNLRRHKLVHTNLKPFECDVCNKAFSDSSSMKRHRFIHSSQRPFFCDVCDKDFKTASNLRDHKRTHTKDRPYKCPMCDTDAFSPSVLAKHIRSVHEGDRPYVCDVCGAAFSWSSSLRKHKKTHTGEKPHACNDCGKAFIQSSNLKKHHLIHTVQQPLPCPYCSATFTWAQSLKRHIGKSHREYCDLEAALNCKAD